MRAWKFDPATAQQEIRRNPRQSEAPQSAGPTEPQRMSADIAEMRAHRRIDEGGVEKAYRQAQDGGLPDGKPMFTTSARDMLRASAEVAREGGAEVVTARHV